MRRKDVVRCRDGRPRKERSDGASAEHRARFLAGLAESCHVGRSALLAGKKDAGIFYQWRLRDPEFAEQWDNAIAIGRARIEAALVARGVASVEAQRAEEAAIEAMPPLQPLDFDQLLKLLSMHRVPPGGRAKGGPKRRYATREETDAVLMERLDVLEKRVRARLAREKEARRAARAAAKAAAAEAG